ncbi:MAG: leucine-rich repeat domain-containing protein [Lachnospiraceae bacterium]|nr:leucine-rich repeat domain-containing protein [Lachnospiraceae bacterium]
MKRFSIRFIAALLMIASLVIAAIPAESFSAEETKSVASEFEIDGNKLIKYTGTASTVSVPDTVKVIGEEAFADNASMKKIVIPKSVEEISYAAFSGCNNLEEVSIPDSVEKIGTASFCNCTGLSKVSIGSGLKKMGTGVFTGCKKLTSVNFSGNTHFVYKDGAIYDDEVKKLYQVLPGNTANKFVMPSTVTSISPYAFYGCKSIKNVELSNKLTEIPPYSFSYCNGLESIKIPFSVHLIDIKAFENCVNLSDVDIPVTTNYIAPSAFDGCRKLNIIAPEDSYAAKWFENFDKSNINIVDEEENTNTSTDTSDKDKEIEPYIAQTVIVARQAVFFIDNTTLTVNGIEKTPDITEMENVLQAETNGKGLSLPKFTVINNSISGKAFYGDTKLTSYDFPENITKIGDFAFARSGLTAVTIPDGVTSIGYGAFYHCDNLTNIVVPTSVTSIETSAFDKTRMMENWKLYGSSDFLILGDGILVSYKGRDKVVNIPDNVKQIGPEAFKGNNYIEEVYLPDKLERICEEAFYGCKKLRNVSGGTALKAVEDRAFYACPLETVRIVDSVKSIGFGAYNMTETDLNNNMKVAYFHGNELPVVSNNKTATRLSNDDYRVHALEGVKVAVVNNESVLRAGTVLDRNESGFSGLVCVISEPNTDYFNGTIRIIDCTMTAEEASSVYIPKTVYVYGKGYNFIESELANTLELARSGAYEGTKENTGEPVLFEGGKEEYLLTVSEIEAVSNDISNAYKRIYADDVPRNTYPLNISLVDKNNYEITKFGKQTLPISIDLPKTVSTQNLHVICIDEYDQLEDLPYRVVAKDEKLYLNFDINHTGEYAIYSYNNSEVLSALGLDESPDTGDHVNPKWFLCTGLFALGLALFFIKVKK